MSEELKSKLERIERIAAEFPSEKTAHEGVDRAADFLAGEAAMANAIERRKAEA